MTDSETLGPLPTEDRTNEMPTDEKIWCDVCWSNFRIPNCTVIRNLTWENKIFQYTISTFEKSECEFNDKLEEEKKSCV